MFEEIENKQPQSQPQQPVQQQPPPVDVPVNNPPINQVANNIPAPSSTGIFANKGIILAVVIGIALIGVVLAGYFLLKGSGSGTEITEVQTVSVSEGVVRNQISDVDDSDIPESAHNDDEGMTVAELLGDYTRRENLPSLTMCYLVKNPEDIKYFPTELQEDYTFFEGDLSEEDQVYMDGTCQFFKEDAYTYYLTLLQTDEDEDGLNLFLEKMNRAEDTKVDTDDDGYSDLVEVINGYNPNDTLTNAIKAKWEIVEQMLEEEDFDEYAAAEICRSMVEDDGMGIDVCLDAVSNRAFDSDFCETAGFSAMTTLKFRCQENVTKNQAVRDNDTAKCLTLNQPDYCLAKIGKNNKTLEPCSLDPDTFIFCAISVYDYLDNTDDCLKYKSTMFTGDYFDGCIASVASNLGDPLLCNDHSDPDWCIANIAK
ncbi:hypothetical protein HOB10_01335 [Candidatus Parcubacteria bacterium]|jgi:hypothetical protein|nr:hypothetical protein [Candidatus Parcubacteria bacterium]